MTARALPTALLLGLALTACGQEPSGVRAAPAPPPSTLPGPAPQREPVGLVPDDHDGPLGILGTVTQEPGQPAYLCLGAQPAIAPLRCGGMQVAGWDWAAVPAGSWSEEMGVTRGTYVLVGTVRGETFTLTDRPRPEADAAQVLPPVPPQEWDFTSPCPPPPGGWAPPEPARTTDATLQEAFTRAQAQEGYGGGWIDQRVPQAELEAGGGNDPLRMVLNVTTTGDGAALEAAVREVWGGALCVSRAHRTEADLRRIQEELHGVPGLDDRGSGSDVRTGQLYVETPVARASVQRELDARFGEGAVVLSGMLRPVRG
ncbi:hypothetical protein NUM3379_23610 [Kineococcus sp. NUM-3379]